MNGTGGELPRRARPLAAHRPAREEPLFEFDFSLPFEVGLGRASLIAEILRDEGYAYCVASDVLLEFAKPGPERSYLGLVATSLIKRSGWRPKGVPGSLAG
jgi:hypothetical protein